MSWQFGLGANVVGKCPITGPKRGMVLARVESICGNRSYEVHSNGKSQLFAERDIELVDEGIAPKLMKAREESSVALRIFESGDVVRLLSGGPSMTVVDYQDRLVTCTWFPATREPRTKVFPDHVLELIETED